MKIRNGFVSNSSSSSFIILLPENFDIETIDFEKEIEKIKHIDAEPEIVKEAIRYLIKNGELWNEEYDYDTMDAIGEILKKYVIAGMDTGPDAGQIILADRKKIKKILGI